MDDVSQLLPPSPEAVSLLEFILNPSPPAFAIAVLLVILTPVLLHVFIFRTPSSTTLPTFLLLGPSSSGKTTLMTTFASSAPTETRTSQSPLALECDIPATLSKSHKFRSTNDPSLRGVQRFLLQDTPGHGKLRPHAVELITMATRGVVFVVDASAAEWSDAAEYLYAILLRIQQLQDMPGNRRESFPVLVACNKWDLFTALPGGKIKALLEAEVEKVREARSKGVVGMGEEDKEEVDMLGAGKGFSFKDLEELGVVVTFRGASTKEDGWRVPLGEWVGENL